MRNHLNSPVVKAFAAVVGIALLAANIGMCSGVRVSKYRIPQGYIGWVRIYYGIEGKPPLPIDDDTLIYDILPSGRLLTSSDADMDEGARMQFFYRDGEQETRLLYYERGALIHNLRSGHFGSLGMVIDGRVVSSGSPDQHYTEFFVGTEEQSRAAAEQRKGEQFLESYREDLERARGTDHPSSERRKPEGREPQITLPKIN